MRALCKKISNLRLIYLIQVMVTGQVQKYVKKEFEITSMVT